VLDDIDRFIDTWNSTRSPMWRTGLRRFSRPFRSSPLIGRPVAGGKRELIIGKGNRGYAALYRYLAGIETVFVLALRAQRESGFKH